MVGGGGGCHAAGIALSYDEEEQVLRVEPNKTKMTATVGLLSPYAFYAYRPTPPLRTVRY